MPLVKGLLITIFSLAAGIVVASAAGPLSAVKAGVKPAAIVTNAPPKQDTLLEIKKKAEAGDAQAQIVFGGEFARMQKYTMAEHWYAQAAMRGDPVGLFALADLYSSSRGNGTNTVKANTTNSVLLHKLAAAQGYGKSHMQLGIAYKNGIGVGKDAVKAYSHFKLADATPNREVYLNQLIAEMSQPQIDAAEKIVAEFKPSDFEKAFADLVFESVRISGIFGGSANRVAMINGKQFGEGQQVSVKIGGIDAQVKLNEIAADGVFVSFRSLERKIKPHRM
jgi:hypothetical protein